MPSQVECDRKVARITWVSFVVNLVLGFFKIIAGVLGHSPAVVADGVHSFTDLCSDVVILVGVRYWSKPADKDHPHGHRRIETLVTFSIGIMLILAGVSLFMNAVNSWREPSIIQPGIIALVAAAVSLGIKELLFRYTLVYSRKCNSVTLKANAWHQRTDAMSSIPVLLVVVVGRLKPTWTFLDPVAVMIVVLFIFHEAFEILKSSLAKLIDTSASEEKILAIREYLETIPEILDVHEIRARYVGDSVLSVDLHIEVDGEMSVREGHDISTLARRLLMEKNKDIVDVIVHLEPYTGN